MGKASMMRVALILAIAATVSALPVAIHELGQEDFVQELTGVSATEGAMEGAYQKAMADLSNAPIDMTGAKSASDKLKAKLKEAHEAAEAAHQAQQALAGVVKASENTAKQQGEAKKAAAEHKAEVTKAAEAKKAKAESDAKAAEEVLRRRKKLRQMPKSRQR